MNSLNEKDWFAVTVYGMGPDMLLLKSVRALDSKYCRRLKTVRPAEHRNHLQSYKAANSLTRMALSVWLVPIL